MRTGVQIGWRDLTVSFNVSGAFSKRSSRRETWPQDCCQPRLWYVKASFLNYLLGSEVGNMLHPLLSFSR